MLLCVLAGVEVSTVAQPDLDLAFNPSPASRGSMLTITAMLDCTGIGPLEGATLYLPLPIGFDQWASKARIDQGAWFGYPANGLIPLGPIPPSKQCTIDIQAFVELAAPRAFSITAQVHDNGGDLVDASAWVNVLPSVDAGADLLVDLGTDVELDGASVADGGGAIAAYDWSDHGAGGLFDAPDTIHPTYTPPMHSGVVELTLRATDIDGGFATDSLRLRVNSPPDVEAGPDCAGDEGEAIPLSGASTSDVDGWVASHAWSDGGAGGRFEPSETVLDPTYVFPRLEGRDDRQVELTLTAVDDWGAVGSDSLMLVIRNVNSPPDVSAGPDRFAAGGASIGLSDATASDEDGWIVSHVWSDGGAGGVFEPSAAVLNPAYRVPRFDGCEDIEIPLELTVTDDQGAQGRDTFVLTVGGTNAPPDIDIGGDVEVQEGETVALLANACDEDGEIASILWEQTSGPRVSILPSENGSTIRFEAPAVEIRETLAFRATAFDNCGASTSDGVLVDVLPHDVDSQRSSLAVRMEAFDAGGFPLLPWDVVSLSERVSFRVIVTNIGQTSLSDLEVVFDDGQVIGVTPSWLDPWDSVSLDITRSAELSAPNDTFEIRIQAVGVDPRGAMVERRSSFVLYVRAGEQGLALDKTIDRTEALVGDTVTYTYTVRNTGDIMMAGLALDDDRLGRIPLPSTEAGAGDVIVANVTYTVRSADLPGPLVNTATLSGYTQEGHRVEAEAVASIELSSDPIGGGGASSRASTFAGRLAISEVAWAGTCSDSKAEWIEIANLSSQAVDLTGWRLCWNEGGIIPPEEGVGCWIDLEGSVDPLPNVALSGGMLRFEDTGGDSLWRIEHPSKAAGYFLLERGSDSAISNIHADQIYDVAFDLPNAGAALFLVSPDGTVVDTANARASTEGGWPAGESNSKATMERIRLDLGDHPGNWQTHPGVLMYGRDAEGRPLLATAGKPNCPSSEELIRAAEEQVHPAAVSGTITVPLLYSETAGPASIRITAAPGGTAGGGGTIDMPKTSTRRSRKGSWLDVNLQRATAGTYYIWISYPDGQSFLLALSK